MPITQIQTLALNFADVLCVAEKVRDEREDAGINDAEGNVEELSRVSHRTRAHVEPCATGGASCTYDPPRRATTSISHCGCDARSCPWGTHQPVVSEGGGQRAGGGRRPRASGQEKQGLERNYTPARPYMRRPGVIQRVTGLPEIPAHLFSVYDLPTTAGSFIGRRTASLRDRPWTLEDCARAGFRYLEWDGITPHVITDCQGRVVVTLVPAPPLTGTPCPADSGAEGTPPPPPPPDTCSEAGKNSRWDKTVEGAAKKFDEEREKGLAAGWLKTEKRRGNFHALASGISHGGGQRRPGILRQATKGQNGCIQRLREDKNVQAIAEAQSNALKTYAPKIHRHLKDRIDRLHQHYAHTARNFKNSIYPASTYNLGPETETVDHIDYGNCPYLLCCITAMGKFNPKKGGHIILFDLKLVVEFPPGATVLLPSGSMRHGNTPIQEGETRYSFTQYCAGGILRWVDFGFRSVAEVKKTGEHESLNGPCKGSKSHPDSNWIHGVSLFPNMSELNGDHAGGTTAGSESESVPTKD